MGATAQIARFIIETEYGQIPAPAVAITRQAILDCIGLTLGGSTMPDGGIIRGYVRDYGGPAEAVVIGSDIKAPADLAALANGVMASATDSTDTSLTWNIGHPTEVLLPTLLGLGDKYGLSGRELVTAYIIGFEVGSRVGTALDRHYEMGWHTTATVGTLAAAAAAARALSLDAEQVEMALGMAASMALGLKQNFGTMTRCLHAGRAAQNGILAAHLARRGFTASRTVFEGPGGYMDLMGGSEAGLDKTVQTLGRSWDITAPGGLSLKLHASCYLSQWCVDAALYLVNTHDIKPDEVARVTCALPGAMGGTLKSHRPGTGFDGMISLEYCIAAALLDRQVGLEQFTDEKVARPEARVLLEKVETVFPPDTRGMSLADAFKYPNAVTIELKNGRVYRHEVDYPKGDIRNPLTEEEGAAKFRSFAGETLSADGKEAVIAATRRLETLSKTSELTRLLAGREQPVRA